MGFYDKVGERWVCKSVRVKKSRSDLYNTIAQTITGKKEGYSEITNALWENLAYAFKTYPYFKDMIPHRMYDQVIKETLGSKEAPRSFFIRKHF